MTAATLAAASGAVGVVGVSDALAVIASSAGSPRRFAGRLLRALGAGQQPTTAERRQLTAVTVCCLLVAGYLVGGLAFALLLTALGPLFATQALRIGRERWRRDLAAGAPAAARAIADALAGGHSPMGAVRAAVRDGSVPGAAGRALESAARAVELGEDPSAVLSAIARRAADASWDAIVAAVLLQRRTGGDLAGLLRRVADVADERERVEADARTLTAQARLTARLVAGMPLAGAVIGELVMPGALGALVSNPISLGLAIVAVIILFASLAAISRLARTPH